MLFNKIVDETKYNIFTVDLEEWFHANYSSLGSDYGQYPVRVVKNTYALLELMSRYNVKATFFVLGYVAKNHPDLVKHISSMGHEIGSHGYSHELVYKQNRQEFAKDVKSSIDLIEDIIGQKVMGYRAPSWSVCDNSRWAWEVLAENNLLYDASVFPTKNYLYGMPDSPRFIYQPVYGDRQLQLYEIPMSTIRVMGKNIGFSGGFYFRALPYWLINNCIRNLNNTGYPAIVYIHPREIDIEQPHLELGLRDRIIHYVGIKHCYDKLEKLFMEYKFVSISTYYFSETDNG